MNILNPSSYVIRATQENKVVIPAIQTVDKNTRLSELLLSRAPNIKKPDGRINCEGLYGDGVIAVTVSPFNKQFRSQIEDGVYPFVETLLEKNYFPISSCEGHTDGKGDHFQITIAIPDTQLAEKVKNYIKLYGCKVEILDSVANNQIEFVTDNTREHKIHFNQNINKTLENLQYEYRDVDILYQRNYSFYVFVKISLFTDGFDRFFSRYWYKVLQRKLLLSYTKYKLLKLLKDEKFPESIY